MKFLKISLLFSAFGLFIFACAQDISTNTTNTANKQITTVTDSTPSATTNPTPADELAEARDIYMEACVKCHKADGTGGENNFEGNKIKVPSFKSPGAMKAGDERFYDHIANGEEGEMPAFKDQLSETQMRNLIKFIRQEFQGK